MKLIKIYTLSDSNKTKQNSINGDPPGACLTGSCPSIYQTDDGGFVIQGFILSDIDKKAIDLSKNEDAVYIPKELIEYIRRS